MSGFLSLGGWWQGKPVPGTLGSMDESNLAKLFAAESGSTRDDYVAAQLIKTKNGLDGLRKEVQAKKDAVFKEAAKIAKAKQALLVDAGLSYTDAEAASAKYGKQYVANEMAILHEIYPTIIDEQGHLSGNVAKYASTGETRFQ